MIQSLRFSRFRVLAVFKCLMALTLAWSIQACTPDLNPSELQSYLSRDDDRWTFDPIPVCFEQASAFALDRKVIQDAVTQEYQRAGVNFTGWDTCTDSAHGLRIRFNEQKATSRTQAFGRNNAGVIASIEFGLMGSCSEPFSGSHCEMNMALHEFGHALGLHHEMNRRDNTSCNLDQTDGQGEKDAIQIGAYDSASIMNYCQLYEANDRNERLGLSHGDIEALAALRLGIIASLRELPPKLIEKSWFGQVQGAATPYYRYAIGRKDTLSCQELESYSPRLPISQGLSIDSATFDEDPETMLTLCLLGEDENGQRQPLSAYSSIDFQVLSAQDSAHLSEQALQLLSPPRLLTENVDGSEQFLLELRLPETLPLSAMSATLSYSDSKVYRSLTADRFQLRTLGEGRYQFIFDKAKFSENGEVFLESLELTDILGRQLRLFSEGARTPLVGSPWMTADFNVLWASDNDNLAPELIEIVGLPTSFSAGKKHSFVMKINENSSLSSLSLYFQSVHGSLLPVVSWVKEDSSSYRVSLLLPNNTINGQYTLDAIVVADSSGTTRSYSRAADERVYAGTDIVAPSVEIIDGITFEQNAPTLLGFAELPEFLSVKKTTVIKLLLSDAAAVTEVRLRLQHVSDQGFYRSIYGIDRGEVAGVRRIELNMTEQHPLGDYVLKEIEISDRFGNQSRYEADEKSLYLSGTQLLVPKFSRVDSAE